MITIPSSLSRPDFVREVLLRDAINIYKAQRLIIGSNIYLRGRKLNTQQRNQTLISERTGRLLNSVTNPNYNYLSDNSIFLLTGSYPIYIRFLDMKKKGNRQVYNRQVWGILYNNAMRDIRNNYGKEIPDYVGSVLQDIFNPTNK